MNEDDWLAPLIPLVQAHVRDRPVLELGCGDGQDTSVLATAGFHVVGIDLSAQALAMARARVPSCEFHCQDIRAPFPPSVMEVNVIVASLSLHYFEWSETVELVDRIRSALSPSGLLLCRLNSTNDHHYGAIGHPKIGLNYYLVKGEPKRFFDRAAVEALFSDGWRTLKLAEKDVRRYKHPKSVWEAVLERSA